MAKGRGTKQETRSSDTSPSSATSSKVDNPINANGGSAVMAAAAVKGKKKSSQRNKGFDLDGVGESSGSSGKEGEGEGFAIVGKIGGGIIPGEDDGEGGYISDALPPHSDDKPERTVTDPDSRTSNGNTSRTGDRNLDRAGSRVEATNGGFAETGNDQMCGVEEVSSGSGRMGAVAIPVAIPSSKSYSISPHLAKLSRLGSYTYSALSTAANITSSAATTARAYATSTTASPSPKTHSRSLPSENMLFGRKGGLEDLVEEGSEVERDSRDGDGLGLNLGGPGEGGRMPSVTTNGDGRGGVKVGCVAGEGTRSQAGHRERLRRESKFIKLDCGDGHPRQCLLLINPTDRIALQIWDVSMVASEDTDRTASQYEADVRQLNGNSSSSASGLGMSMLSSVLLEGSPREIFCLCRGQESGAAGSSGLEGEVVDAIVVDGDSEKGCHARKATLTVATVAAGNIDGAPRPKISLAKIDLTTSRIFAEREIGHGFGATLLASERFLAVGLANDVAPEIHILSPVDLRTLHKPITSRLGASATTGLPVMALSGRMLAYATRKCRYPGPKPGDRHDKDHGAIVTKRSARKSPEVGSSAACMLPRHPSGGSTGGSNSQPPYLHQSSLLSSASSVTSQMASGLWGGLKALSTAAVDSAARSGVVSRSAPSESLLGGLSVGPPESLKARRRLSVGATGSPDLWRSQAGGSWIEIVDLGERTPKANIVAAFSLPGKSIVPAEGLASSMNVGCLEFDGTGTQLAIFPEDGRIGYVVEIRPRARGSQARDSGEVWVKYEFLRGYTASSIFSIQWNFGNNFVAVSSRNTIHVFAVHPDGGKVGIRDYTGHHRNHEDPLSLSTKTAAAFRVRVNRTPSQSEPSHPAERDSAQSTGRVENRPEPRITFAFATGAGHYPAESANAAVISAPMLYFDNDTAQLTVSRSKLWAAGVAGHRTPDRLDLAGHTNASQAAGNAERVVDGLRWRSPIEGRNEAQRCWRMYTRGADDCTGALDLAVVRMPTKSRILLIDCFAAAEMNTASLSARTLPVTLYRSKNVDMFDLRSLTVGKDGIWLSAKLKFATTRAGSTEWKTDATGSSLGAAIRSELDAEQVSPVPPALPNGETSTFWKASRHPILIAAKDMRKMRRKDSQHSDEMPSSFGDRLAVDEETGFMYEQGTEDEAQSRTSPDGSSLNEEWEDDLIMGKMDGVKKA